LISQFVPPQITINKLYHLDLGFIPSFHILFDSIVLRMFFPR